MINEERSNSDPIGDAPDDSANIGDCWADKKLCSESSNETLADDMTPESSCIAGASGSTSELSASREFLSADHHGDVPPSEAVRYEERDCKVPSEAVTKASSSVVLVDDLKLEFHSYNWKRITGILSTLESVKISKDRLLTSALPLLSFNVVTRRFSVEAVLDASSASKQSCSSFKIKSSDSAIFDTSVSFEEIASQAMKLPDDGDADAIAGGTTLLPEETYESVIL